MKPTISKPKNKGTCSLCNQIFDQDLIEGHLDDCIKRNIPSTQEGCQLVEIFRIKMSAGIGCWYYIETLANASLQDLDDLLQSILLDDKNQGEFHINGTFNHKPSRKIENAFKKGTNFCYEYDAGSYSLDGQIVDCYKGYLDKKTRILARHNCAYLECNDCVAKPKFICSNCCNYFCTKCLKNMVVEKIWQC